MPKSLVVCDGFSLIEALVAALLAAAAIATLAHLVAAAVLQSADSRRAVTAIALAQSKLDELRGLAWAYADDGSRVSSGSLATSPADALETDSAGHVDRLEAFGEILEPPAAAAEFTRRWAVSPADPADPDTLLLRVCVYASARPDALRTPPAACVAALRTRKR